MQSPSLMRVFKGPFFPAKVRVTSMGNGANGLVNASAFIPKAGTGLALLGAKRLGLLVVKVRGRMRLGLCVSSAKTTMATVWVVGILGPVEVFGSITGPTRQLRWGGTTTNKATIARWALPCLNTSTNRVSITAIRTRDEATASYVSVITSAAPRDLIVSFTAAYVVPAVVTVARRPVSARVVQSCPTLVLALPQTTLVVVGFKRRLATPRG